MHVVNSQKSSKKFILSLVIAAVFKVLLMTNMFQREYEAASLTHCLSRVEHVNTPWSIFVQYFHCYNESCV